MHESSLPDRHELARLHDHPLPASTGQVFPPADGLLDARGLRKLDGAAGGLQDWSLRYFRQRLSIPRAFQVSLDGERDFVEDGVRCLPAARFLAALA